MVLSTMFKVKGKNLTERYNIKELVLPQQSYLGQKQNFCRSHTENLLVGFTGVWDKFSFYFALLKHC